MDSGIIVYDYKDTFFCCEVERDQWCEDRVSEHMLVYLCSGEMDLIAPDREYHLGRGDAFFVRRNHLVKKIKHPGKNGEPFKGIFLQLKMPFLRRMVSEHRVVVPPASSPGTAAPVYFMLEKHPFLTALFSSLELYFDAGQYPSEQLMNAKQQEAVFTLLQLHPELAQVLFDFSEPWKVSLKEFMEKNFKCDLSIEQFAHYTGRSLTAFKKDFADTFHQTPGRWIVQRRLQAARELMEGRGRKPSEVYLEVGFKSISHFSTAFKREYGIAPSAINLYPPAGQDWLCARAALTHRDTGNRGVWEAQKPPGVDF